VVSPNSQAVIVRFSYGSTHLSRLFALEEQLKVAILAAKAGEYDGHVVAVDGSNGVIYMYGPDADRLFQVVKPVLESAEFMRGASATVRFGPTGSNTRQRTVTMNT
jgi:hypothetical protein